MFLPSTEDIIRPNVETLYFIQQYSNISKAFTKVDSKYKEGNKILSHVFSDVTGYYHK